MQFTKCVQTNTIRSSNISNHFYNFRPISYRNMKSIILRTISASILVAMLMLTGILAFPRIYYANAQMVVSNLTGGGMMNMMSSSGPNITGTIKLSTVMGNALASQIKLSLSQSAVTAEKTAGNNSHAVAANLGVENGYLVYTVWLVDGSYNFHKVIVDAGNGKVLSNQPVSKVESMMMHGMMMRGGGMMIQHGPDGMMMRGGGLHGMKNGGPGMSAPWHKW